MVFVTGGTGALGSELLRRLSQAGVVTRALTRNPQKAPNLPGITWVGGDLAKSETLTKAFGGAQKLFLLTSYYEDMVTLQHNAIVAAREPLRQSVHKGTRRHGSARRGGLVSSLWCLA